MHPEGIRQKRFHIIFKTCLAILLACVVVTISKTVEASGNNQTLQTIGKVTKIVKDGNDIFLNLTTGESMKVHFLKDNVFRLYLDPDKEFPMYPAPNKPNQKTTIVNKTPDDYQAKYGAVDVNIDENHADYYAIKSKRVALRIDKETSKMSLYDLKRNKLLWTEAVPLQHSKNKTTQTLQTKDKEYFYGGGQQNGYFSHKNETINIKIGGGWDAGAASSPAPFYVSTEGYGVMRNTFQPGQYDFSQKATFNHDENRFDAYYFVADTLPKTINEYTELTGKPVLLPKFAFYLGHADCFNGKHNGHGDQRTLMKDGLDYLKDYMNHDIPLGWFLPNDGYSCGYGGLDNLGKFVEKANDQGVEIGLWTQSNLKPDPNLDKDDPLRRDLDGEVKAGIRGIKTDVAWVGQGYSMALNATHQAAKGLQKKKNSNGARPFIISLDGWAGTQRYAGLWTGDQYGGNWEYIRMHIPTYIGAGLSGNPNVGSDMDGIFGGDKIVQTRDFQWKAFTPIQIDMDGWASTGNDYSKEKNPWNYGEPYTSINRMYLKLKAQMMPYIYSNAEEATETSMPMIRGMMLEYPDDSYTYGTKTKYQYMWGPNLLVAPVYNGNENAAGIRNNIYLPDKNQTWIDYFTGEQYQGGAVIDNFKAPLWKTPVFVKNGAIIPMAPENNSNRKLDGGENRIFDIYPSGKSEFTLYDDDGKTVSYKDGFYTKTHITSEVADDKAVIKVGLAKGKGYKGMVKKRGTTFHIHTRKQPKKVSVHVGEDDVKLKEVKSLKAFNEGENVFYYNEKPNLNKYATKGSSFADKKIITAPKLQVKVGKTDITKNAIVLTVDGFNNQEDKKVLDKLVPDIPQNLDVGQVTDSEISLNWSKVKGEHVTYDLKIDGVIHRNVFDENSDQKPTYQNIDLESNSTHHYQIRAVNTKGTSAWSKTVKIKTKKDRYRNVPKNMTAKADSEQPGQEAGNAIDGKDNTLWHTDWTKGNKLPHTFDIDMKLAYQLDKFEYLPRPDAGNGTILQYDLDVSMDGKVYKKVITDGTFSRNKKLKTIHFDKPIQARYIRLTIKKAVGGFASAQEFRPYKKDKTSGWVVGKNISDGSNGNIGEDDLNFFSSYLGVNQTDTAWKQVSRGDINYNGVIDAYDLMYVAGKLGKEPLKATGKKVKGIINLQPLKRHVAKGDSFDVDVMGLGLQDINAFGLEMLLDTTKYKVVKTKPSKKTKGMAHFQQSNGKKSAAKRFMIAFANKGKQNTLNGDLKLATITLKAREDIDFDTKINQSLLVNTSFQIIDKIGEINLPKIDMVADLENLVSQLGETGDITDEKALQLLKTHLKSIHHYVQKDDKTKVIKHLKGLKVMLKHQQKQGVMSEEAYDRLFNGANDLLEKWK